MVRESSTNSYDLLCPREAMFFKVIGQVQEGASLQVMAVTEDDQQTLLLHKQKDDYILKDSQTNTAPLASNFPQLCLTLKRRLVIFDCCFEGVRIREEQ